MAEQATVERHDTLQADKPDQEAQAVAYKNVGDLARPVRVGPFVLAGCLTHAATRA
jgi:hypothetical protein